MRRIPVLLLLALAAACETAYKDGLPNERSPYFLVPVDSRLVLHRRVSIAPSQSTAYFQYGKLLPWYDVNQYAPYCALALDTIRDVAQSVDPDEFVIRKVSQQHLFTLAAAPLPQERLVKTRRSGNGNGATYEVVATVMELRSERQADVRTLTCASWGLPQRSSYLTVERTRRALGTYFTLKLAGGKP